jgi:hypothetical protein
MEDLVVERVADEHVVYDERSAGRAKLAIVERALDKLRENDLLKQTITVRPGYSRRGAGVKFASVRGVRSWPRSSTRRP